MDTQSINGWLTDIGSILGTASSINSQLNPKTGMQESAPAPQTLNNQQSVTGMQIGTGVLLLVVGVIIVKMVM